MGLGFAEVSLAFFTLDSAHPREMVAVLVALAASLAALVRATRAEGEASAAILAQLAVALGWGVVRKLGFDLTPGPIDAFAALLFGAILGGVRRRAEEPQVRGALALGAFAWPVAGLFALAPWSQQLALGLAMLSVHHAALARDKSLRKWASTAAALFFNAALLTLWLDAHLDGLWYLVLPVGLSILVLVKVFDDVLPKRTQAQLRSIVVASMYAAAAWKPLAFDVPWAMWLCVLVCVVGVAVGVALRVRSYVMLGTVFLVTTVVANLVRFGVREPRVGALFLSGLGLLVVGFMVLITTRRAQLLEQYRRVTLMLAQWEA
jgi:hypothetical protein